MTYQPQIAVSEFHMPAGRTVIAKFDTFAEAKGHVEALGAVYMEDDADYPNCADAYLNDGRVIAIQPVGFTL